MAVAGGWEGACCREHVASASMLLSSCMHVLHEQPRCLVVSTSDVMSDVMLFIICLASMATQETNLIVRHYYWLRKKFHYLHKQLASSSTTQPTFNRHDVMHFHNRICTIM